MSRHVLGFLIGLVMAGYIAALMLDTVGWRPLFLVGFFAPAAVIILLAFKLPESARWLSVRGKTEKQRESLARILGAIQPGIHINESTRSPRPTRAGEALAKELFAGRLLWVTPLIWALYLISSIAVFFFGSWSPELLVVKGFSASTAAFITGTTASSSRLAACSAGSFSTNTGSDGSRALRDRGSVRHIHGRPGAGRVRDPAFRERVFHQFRSHGRDDSCPDRLPVQLQKQGAGTAVAVARIGPSSGRTSADIFWRRNCRSGRCWR